MNIGARASGRPQAAGIDLTRAPGAARPGRAPCSSSRVAALALGVALLTFASRASAAPAAEARFFDERARSAYTKRDYRGALRYFLLAAASAPSAGTLYNVAITAELAGELGLAWSFLGRYLAAPDEDATRREEAQRRFGRLRDRLALVRVESEPPGALVYVDRRQFGAYGSTPCTVPVTPGERRIMFELPGYAPGSVSATAEVGQELTARAALVPIMGELAVTLDPPALELTFSRDGRTVTPERVGSAWRLPVGTYVVRGTAARYSPVELMVAVSAGARTRLELVARPLPAATGSLLVSTGSVPAEIILDGKRRAVTPARLDAVPVGDHDVELVAKGMIRWRGRVKVEKGTRRYLNVTLRPGSAGGDGGHNGPRR